MVGLTKSEKCGIERTRKICNSNLFSNLIKQET